MRFTPIKECPSTLPNVESIALHEKFGMKQIAHFKEVGFKFKQWLEVGYWQGEL